MGALLYMASWKVTVCIINKAINASGGQNIDMCCMPAVSDWKNILIDWLTILHLKSGTSDFEG